MCGRDFYRGNFYRRKQRKRRGSFEEDRESSVSVLVNGGNTVNNFFKYFLTQGVKSLGLNPVSGTVATLDPSQNVPMKKLETSKTEGRAGHPAKADKAPPVTVLHVDDDPNDTTLLQVACARAAVDFELRNIGDGMEVIEYLNGDGKYADRSQYQMPGLVLLDWKMPRATGLEILQWIRKHPMAKHLPVIVLSGSEFQEDMRNAYAVGANSYLVKPPNFESLVKLVKSIGAQLQGIAISNGGTSRSSFSC